jgi:hypothetical protein
MADPALAGEVFVLHQGHSKYVGVQYANCATVFCQDGSG